MKQIVEAFSAVVLITLCAYVSIALITVNSDIMAAKEYKADVIAEIENSNFNPYVVEGCIQQAQAAGYTLQIHNSSYDTDQRITSAEVILGYEYKLPIFGISETKTTRGIAR